MGCFDPRHLRDPVVAEARREARLVLLVARARLRAGQPPDLPRLAALAEDERLTPRLRVRAATMLAQAWLGAVATAAGQRSALARRDEREGIAAELADGVRVNNGGSWRC